MSSMGATDSVTGLIAGLVVCAVGVAVMCAAAWLIGKGRAESGAPDAGQQPPDGDDGDQWENLTEDEKAYLRRFFK